MFIICCLFLFFPVGLVIAQLSDEKVQYLWFSYQLYAVIAMHIVRLLGLQDVPRTEVRIARLLSAGKTVRLSTATGCAVSATLVTHSVSKTAEGKLKVQEIINECSKRLAVRAAERLVEGRAQKEGNRNGSGLSVRAPNAS